MTSSNTLKKIASIGAAVLLAVGGSITVAAPASAAVPTPQSGFGGGGYFYAAPTNYLVGDTAAAATGSWNAGMSSVNAATHEWFSCTSSSALVTDTNACTARGSAITASTYQGNPLTTTYTVQSGDIGKWLKVKIVATAPVSLGDGGTSAPSIITSANAVLDAPTATFDPNGGVAGSITSLTGGVIWLPSLAHGGAGALPTRTNCFFQGWGTAANSTNPEFSMSATVLMSSRTYYAIWSGSCLTAPQSSPSSSSSSSRPLTPEQAKNAIKPLPAAVQQVVGAIPSFNKPLVAGGGKIDASSGDFTGLVSATIGGKTVDFKSPTGVGISLTVPTGKAGTTADLVLTFKTGPIIFQDAIKYVAPVVVAEVPARPVSVSSSSKTFSEEAQNEIRRAAFANVKNTAVSCVAYAASNSASSQAAALDLATRACAIANKANSDLAITGVSVVVDKLKARTQGVGIKVYKADN